MSQSLKFPLEVIAPPLRMLQLLLQGCGNLGLTKSISDGQGWMLPPYFQFGQSESINMYQYAFLVANVLAMISEITSDDVIT